MLISPPPSLGSLLMKNDGFCEFMPSGLPPFTVLIDTGTGGCTGSSALFAPLTKKPKTSLKAVLANSLYSSEANTYSKVTWLAVGTKLNSSTALSYSVLPLGMRDSRSASGVGVLENPSPVLSMFGTLVTLATDPELSMMPLSKPTALVPPLNVPKAAMLGVQETDPGTTVIPGPSSLVTRSMHCVVLFVLLLSGVTTSCARTQVEYAQKPAASAAAMTRTALPIVPPPH